MIAKREPLCLRKKLKGESPQKLIWIRSEHINNKREGKKTIKPSRTVLLKLSVIKKKNPPPLKIFNHLQTNPAVLHTFSMWLSHQISKTSKVVHTLFNGEFPDHVLEFTAMSNCYIHFFIVCSQILYFSVIDWWFVHRHQYGPHHEENGASWTL